MEQTLVDKKKIFTNIVILLDINMKYEVQYKHQTNQQKIKIT